MKIETSQELVRRILAAGYSQAALGQAVGLSQSTVGRIADGTHKDTRASVYHRLRAFAAEHVDSKAAA